MNRRISMLAALLVVATAWARPAMAEPPPGEIPVDVVDVREPEAIALPALHAQGTLALPSFAGVGVVPSLRLNGTPMRTVNVGSGATRDRGRKMPFSIAGGICLGLGGATLMVSGITWLVAASAAAQLDDECPGGLCVEGTRGGDAYVTARDGLRAADILAGVGFPLMGTGIVLLVYSTALGPRYASLKNGPFVAVGPGGANLAVRF